MVLFSLENQLFEYKRLVTIKIRVLGIAAQENWHLFGKPFLKPLKLFPASNQAENSGKCKACSDLIDALLTTLCCLVMISMVA